MIKETIPWTQPDDTEVARIAAHLAFHVATQNERDRLRTQVAEQPNQQKGELND